MTHVLAIEILLGLGVVLVVFCSLGVLVMKDPFQRIHYIAPAASISALCVAAAILLAEGFNQAGIKAVLVVVLLFIMNAVLSHATARAIRIRQYGDWTPRPEEQVIEAGKGGGE